MTSLRGMRQLCLAIIVFLLLVCLTMGAAPAFAQSGSAASSAVPSDGTPGIGEQIVVSINIDMSSVEPPGDALGSFTGTLDWDPAVIAYNSDSGILAGFTGIVNDADVSSGHIIFNGANPSGATGNIIVLTITFDVIGTGSSVLDLGYTSMATAFTFEDLLPILTINDGDVSVIYDIYFYFYLPVIFSGTSTSAIDLSQTILEETEPITASILIPDSEGKDNLSQTILDETEPITAAVLIPDTGEKDNNPQAVWVEPVAGGQDTVADNPNEVENELALTKKESGTSRVAGLNEQLPWILIPLFVLIVSIIFVLYFFRRRTLARNQ